MPSSKRPRTKIGDFLLEAPGHGDGNFLFMFIRPGLRKGKAGTPTPADRRSGRGHSKKTFLFTPNGWPRWTAWSTPTIRAQVQGYLVKQNYKEGDLVKKGQVLFEIDPRSFQAALDQAKADRGPGTKPAGHTAKANLARIRPLAAQNAVSQKDLDDAIARRSSPAQRLGQYGQGRGRQGPVEPRIHQNHLPDRRHRRHRQGPDRKSGGPRGDRRTDDGLHGQTRSRPMSRSASRST